jgi:hypothetical protein
MQRTSRRRRPVLLLLAAGLPLAACAQGSAGSSKAESVKIEPLEQGGLSRVVLTEKAAQRLGIETTPVREELVVRTRAVGGEVLGLGAGPAPASQSLSGAGSGAGAASAGVADLGGVLVRVRLLESDAEKVDRSGPARVLPLEVPAGRGGGGASLEPLSGTGGYGARPPRARGGADPTAGATGLVVRPVAAPAAGDAEGATAALYYAPEGTGHGLAPAQRVLVELPLGTGEPRRVIPYSAVLYDLKGEAWVYTSPQPLGFVRQRVSVDYIDGELAVLLEGPPAGAAVVTVGATELYGAESGVGKK